MTYELPFDDAYEPYYASSPTDRVILELQMYGHRPHQDEPDPRPLPDDEVIRAGLAGIVETFAGMLGDTRLEPDLESATYAGGETIQVEVRDETDEVQLNAVELTITIGASRDQQTVTIPALKPIPGAPAASTGESRASTSESTQPRAASSGAAASCGAGWSAGSRAWPGKRCARSTAR